jgi:hypothetical protein
MDLVRKNNPQVLSLSDDEKWGDLIKSLNGMIYKQLVDREFDFVSSYFHSFIWIEAIYGPRGSAATESFIDQCRKLIDKNGGPLDCLFKDEMILRKIIIGSYYENPDNLRTIANVHLTILCAIGYVSV